jgi:hypothetical protein
MQRKLDALERKLSAIQGENQTLKDAANGEVAPPVIDPTAEDGFDINELQMFYDMARKIFGEGDVQVVTAKERLDNARAMANGKKPLAKRFSTLEFKITKAKKNKEKADGEVRQTEKAIADLQATLEKQQATALSKVADLEAVESELKSLLNQNAAEAADDGIINVDDPFAGMPKSWRVFLEAREDKTELLAGYSAATVSKKTQAATVGTAAASQESAATPVGPTGAAEEEVDFEGDFDMPEYLKKMFGDENEEGIDPNEAAWIAQRKKRLQKGDLIAGFKVAKRRKC